MNKTAYVVFLFLVGSLVAGWMAAPYITPGIALGTIGAVVVAMAVIDLTDFVYEECRRLQ